MRLGRAIVGTLVMVGAAAAAAASGCVSNPTTPSPLPDGATPLGEGGAPPAVDGAPGVDSTAAPTDAGADTTTPPIPEAGGDTAPGADAADAALPHASVRFGWFASSMILKAPQVGRGPQGIASLGPDFCVAPHGTGQWQGPLLAAAGLGGGMQSFTVSSYFSVPAGQDDVRVVPPGYSSCEPPDGGADGGYGVGAPHDITNLPAIPPGASITIGIADSTSNDAGAGLAVTALVDETTTTAGKAKLRLVNVAGQSPDAVSLLLGSGVAAQPLFLDVTPTQEIDPLADPRGYREINPVASIDTTFQDLANTIATPAVALPAGTILTTFVTERLGDGSYQYVLVSCFDGQPSAGNAALTNCAITTSSSSQGYTRFANFIADKNAPAADVCIRYHDLSGPFAGPLLGGPAGDAGADAGPPIGLAPPMGFGVQSAVSGYFQVTGGFQYDVRYVPAGSGSCGAGLAADYLYAAPAAANATVAATGFITVPNDAGEPGMFDGGAVDGGPDAGPPSTGLASVALAYETFVDENGSASDAVRVVHLAGLNPQPFDVSAASWTFTDIPYGGVGRWPAGVDANGYRTVATGGGSFNVYDVVTGAMESSLSFGMSTNESDTFFIYSYDNGSFPVTGVLECRDATFTLGGLWTCSALNGG